MSDAQREQLSGFPPEVDAEVLDRFFTLSGADLAEVRRRHGDSNRLGWALQLCGLRMLGFCPDDMATVPAVAVRFLARQLDVDPGSLGSYGGARPDPHGPPGPGEGVLGLPIGHARRP